MYDFFLVIWTRTGMAAHGVNKKRVNSTRTGMAAHGVNKKRAISKRTGMAAHGVNKKRVISKRTATLRASATHVSIAFLGTVCGSSSLSFY